MEHADGPMAANPAASTNNLHTASAAEPAAKEEQLSTTPPVTHLTGDDKVIGPNAPVGVLHPEKQSPSPESVNPSTTSTQVTEEKEKPESATDNGSPEVAATSGEKTQDGGPAETKEGESAENTVDEQNDDSKYPGGTVLALLTFGLCMATFVVALDNTIIATAIPKITTVFDSLNDVGWYGSSYLLTTTALQPPSARFTPTTISSGHIFPLFSYLRLVPLSVPPPQALLCSSWVEPLLGRVLPRCSRVV